MIKNVYDKVNKQYRHHYYCDNCFTVLNYGEILRHDFAIQAEKFDLCIDCGKSFDTLMRGIDLLVKEDK